MNSIADKGYITLKVSKKIGRAKILHLKKYIKSLESDLDRPKKRVPQAIINKLADEINEGIWEKFKKAHGL